MKINISKESNKSKAIAIIVVSVLLATAAASVFAYQSGFFGATTETVPSSYTEPATEEQIKDGNTTKEENVKPTQQEDQTTPAENADFTVILSAANQSQDIVQIRALIQTIASSGTCTLTMTKGGVTVQKTAPVQASASNSTCQGFNVPTSELTPGTWLIDLSVALPEGTSSVSGSIDVR